MLEALRQGMGRHQRRAFWEATIAVCALVGAPDGKVSFATRVRIDHILDNLPDLKIFDTSEFVETFDRFVEEFRVSPRKARSRALEVARKGAGSSDEAELLARIACVVADTEAPGEHVDLEPIEALCDSLNLDVNAVIAAASAAQDKGGSPAAPVDSSTPPVPSPRVEDSEKEKPEMQEEQTPSQGSGVAAAAPLSDNNGTGEAQPGVDVPDLSQQLLVDGTKAVIALCGRTKTGAMEALRIYENEQFAAADCALSEKIANEKFWLSPVTLFPSNGSGGDAGDDGEPTPIHVLCLSRPDGSIEALRAFESADHAGADLEFFRNISNDKMWISVVQFKTVT